MGSVNIKHIFAIMPVMQPLVKLFITEKLPIPLGSYAEITEIEKEGKKYFVVIDQTKYATEEEAKNHMEINKKLEDMSKTLQKVK